MAYCIFRNESANGKSGVNNNYAGIQADVGRWKNIPGQPIATSVRIDSGNQISYELLCVKVTERGMVTADDYFKKWVGLPSSDTPATRAAFASLLHSAETAIP